MTSKEGEYFLFTLYFTLDETTVLYKGTYLGDINFHCPTLLLSLQDHYSISNVKYMRYTQTNSSVVPVHGYEVDLIVI